MEHPRAALTGDEPAAAPRFVVGIDLGTTNSAVAWADLDDPSRVRRFGIPQLTGEGELGAPDTLPSFLYLATQAERDAGRLGVPWNESAPIVGHWARDRGMEVPGRLVSSAKSWLSHPDVDRRAKLLPWSVDPAERQISPVDASSACLRHIRDAWNHVQARAALEAQEIVLTVPASFDEEARELTIEAARAAGFVRLTLIEEPAAALYAWIAAHPESLAAQLSHGDRILVCDVGGGTTDFTLVETTVADGEVAFERVRVGEHLLLGGDNVDLALARLVADRLGRPRLSIVQQESLRRRCAVVKELLLGPPGADRADVTVLGSGRAVVGGSLTTEVSREEVLATVLDGFLPDVPRDAAPDVDRRSGLRELALPYASDPAITRHLAAFLRNEDGSMARPDLVLFNGGFFTPDEVRARVVDVVAAWFGRESGWRPRVLVNRAPATAVADGAAYYGLVRHGHGLRIGGGSPRGYYIGLRQAAGGGEAEVQAVCVLPRGVQEETTLDLTDRNFMVSTNEALAFTLFSSRTREDAAGDVISVPASRLHRHAPLVTELRFGKRSRSVEIPVQVEARYTELGTLALDLVSRGTEHRWRLEFALRRPVRDAEAGPASEAAEESTAVSAEAVAAAVDAVRDVFGPSSSAETAPGALMARLEEVLGVGRHGWPLSLIRALCDALLDLASGRMLSAAHEARYLNLLGFCLRPGFGTARDAARVAQARRIYVAGLAFPSEIQGQSEWLVLWQRIAPGMSASQQREMFQRYAATVGLKTAAPRRLHAQVERETWRLLACLEQVDAASRAAVGEAVARRLRRDRQNASLLWALARAGGRVPFHGPLDTVVPPDQAAAWMRAVLQRPELSEAAAETVARLGAFTADPARDVPEGLRREAAARIEAGGHPALARRLLEPMPQARGEAERLFGESLPEGLRLEA